MGKATRWLKGLLGMKKEKENVDSLNIQANTDRKEKKRWSFAKSGKATNAVSNVPSNSIPNIPDTDSAWLRSYMAESEKEQNKHAIAVAAATAAAADAAVAAAQAAVAVVRLTSQGNGRKIDQWAAVKIQTVFRGYLARKALRALKGLVKLQALVRGYLVRKRAAATLYSMQALIRAQTAARSQRARRSFKKDNKLYPEFNPRKSIERYDETRSEFHSKRLSTTYEAFGESSPKIVEIDTFKPRSRRFSNIALSEYGEDVPYNTISSPLPNNVPGRISVTDYRCLQDFECYFDGQERKVSTAQSTPRFGSSLWSNVPGTPAKSVCGDSLCNRSYSNFPNYMTNTQSFKAKLRSQSAPKQRPEPVSKKRLSLDEIMAARNSVSSVRMQRAFPQVVQEEEEEEEGGAFNY